MYMYWSARSHLASLTSHRLTSHRCCSRLRLLHEALLRLRVLCGKCCAASACICTDRPGILLFQLGGGMPECMGLLAELLLLSGLAARGPVRHI